MAKKFTSLRMYRDDKFKLDEIINEISYTQKKQVKTPETLRRIFNIPNLKEVLKRDAEFKRRIK